MFRKKFFMLIVINEKQKILPIYQWFSLTMHDLILWSMYLSREYSPSIGYMVTYFLCTERSEAGSGRMITSLGGIVTCNQLKSSICKPQIKFLMGSQKNQRWSNLFLFSLRRTFTEEFLCNSRTENTLHKI